MNVVVRGRTQPCRTVAFDRAANAVRLIEQRLLPHAFKIVATRTFRETAAAIRDMIVRGAPAIAATAAYGLAQGALAFRILAKNILKDLLPDFLAATAAKGGNKKIHRLADSYQPSAIVPKKPPLPGPEPQPLSLVGADEAADKPADKPADRPA